MQARLFDYCRPPRRGDGTPDQNGTIDSQFPIPNLPFACFGHRTICCGEKGRKRWLVMMLQLIRSREREVAEAVELDLTFLLGDETPAGSAALE